MAGYTDFDFRAWVQRAQEFTETLAARLGEQVVAEARVAPALSEEAVAELAAGLDRGVPAVVRRFLVQGAGGLGFGYQWTPAGAAARELEALLEGKSYVWGGGPLCLAGEFREWVERCDEWIEESWIGESAEQARWWRESFPILSLDTGDFLALDLSRPAEDPAVVYLCHDEESDLIAPSFTRFLTEWERLGYLGPDRDLLELFFDEEGFLSGEGEEAAALRALLQGET